MTEMMLYFLTLLMSLNQLGKFYFELLSPETAKVKFRTALVVLTKYEGCPGHSVRVPFNANLSTGRDADGTTVSAYSLGHAFKTGQYGLVGV